MNNFIIGRKHQLQELADAYRSAGAEFVALIGRRRVGKTFLVRKAYQNKIDFELTGLQHASKKEQLLKLLVALPLPG